MQKVLVLKCFRTNFPGFSARKGREDEEQRKKKKGITIFFPLKTFHTHIYETQINPFVRREFSPRLLQGFSKTLRGNVRRWGVILFRHTVASWWQRSLWQNAVFFSQIDSSHKSTITSCKSCKVTTTMMARVTRVFISVCSLEVAMIEQWLNNRIGKISLEAKIINRQKLRRWTLRGFAASTDFVILDTFSLTFLFS